MSTTVPIPGGTATLRDPATLPERQRRLIQTTMSPMAKIFRKLPPDLLAKAAGTSAAAKKAQAEAERLMGEAVETRQEAAAVLELRDAVIVALLQDWDLARPLPTMDTVQDLDHELYAALDAATRALTPAAMSAGTPVDFDPQPLDADTPFVESVTSSNGSKAGRRRPTLRLSPDGVSTSTADTSVPD